MFSRFSQRIETHRPWIFLWVLPYLLLNLAGVGLHNHGLSASTHGDAASLSLCKSHTSERDFEPHAPTSAAHDECLACQWAAHSVVAIFGDAPAVVAARYVVFSWPAPRVAPSDFRIAASTRGPPL